MHIIIGILMMAAGALITVYSEKMLNAFGAIAWFEKYLGVEGGSRLGYKLSGIFVFFLGVLALTNLIQGFLFWVLSPLLGLGRGGA